MRRASDEQRLRTGGAAKGGVGRRREGNEADEGMDEGRSIRDVLDSITIAYIRYYATRNAVIVYNPGALHPAHPTYDKYNGQSRIRIGDK